MRIVIEKLYSIENRAFSKNELPFELPPQPYFKLIFHNNEIFFSNPHTIWSTDSQGKVLIIRLAPESLIETAIKLRMHKSGVQLLFNTKSLSQTDDSILWNIVESINVELKEQNYGRREMISSLIDQLTLYLLRKHVNTAKSDDMELSRVGIVDRRLRRSIEYMHDNCHRELKLDEIADAAYLSEFHFARLFKKVTGISPHQYLANLRIDRAKKLLAETDLSITEIGIRVGYAGHSHFTKIFRQAIGMAPSEFRKSLL